jgi:Flp pilus assembly pilin Flp
MNDRITRVQQRFGAWCAAWIATARSTARSDDRGAFTTETAIITGVLAVLAVAVGTIISTKAKDWANSIPGVGG